MTERILTGESLASPTPHIEKLSQDIKGPNKKRALLEDFISQGFHHEYLDFLNKYPKEVFLYATQLRDPFILKNNELTTLGKLIKSTSRFMNFPRLSRQLTGRLFEDLGYVFLKSRRNYLPLRVLSPRKTFEVFSQGYQNAGVSESFFVDEKGGAKIKVPQYSFRNTSEPITLYMPDGAAINDESNEVSLIEYKIKFSPEIHTQAGMIDKLFRLLECEEGVGLKESLAHHLNIEDPKFIKPTIVYKNENQRRTKLAKEVVEQILGDVNYMDVPLSVAEIKLVRDALIADHCLNLANQND